MGKVSSLVEMVVQHDQTHYPNLSPFQVIYGRPPPIISNYITGNTHILKLDRWAFSRGQLLQAIKINLRKAQSRMKNLADQLCSDKEFNVGSWVFVKLQPFRQTTIRSNRHKLLKKILRTLPNHRAYRTRCLQTPTSSRFPHPHSFSCFPSQVLSEPNPYNTSTTTIRF